MHYILQFSQLLFILVLCLCHEDYFVWEILIHTICISEQYVPLNKMPLSRLSADLRSCH